MQNPEQTAACLVAAFFVLGLKAIPRDQITLDAYGNTLVAGKPPKRSDANRIGILTCLVLECAGLETEPTTMLELSEHPYHRHDVAWIASNLRDGQILEIVGEFLMLRENT